MMIVSIIVPTYKDWSRLALCVDALANQSYDRNFIEVIIVNNAPGDVPPPNFILPFNSQIISEEKPGSYAARNAGLAIAKGEIVGFTDADCVPDRDWVKNALKILMENPSVQRLAGAVKIFYEQKKATSIELYDRVYGFPQEHYAKNGLAVTANMFTYLKNFSLVGPFNSETMSGGDFEWAKRAREKGLQIKFAPNVLVLHPARKSLKLLFQKAKRVGKGQVILIPVKNNLNERILDVIQILRPKTWEIKRVRSLGDEIELIDKILIIILRHLLLWTSDYWRITTRLKKRHG